MQHISPADYIKFLIYCLEYKLLVLEQLSEIKERKLLATTTASKEECDSSPPPELEQYGVILQHTILRHLSGVGSEHIGSDGRSIASAAVEVSETNYAEILGQTLFVNAHWLFTALWYFLQGILDPRYVSRLGGR